MDWLVVVVVVVGILVEVVGKVKSCENDWLGVIVVGRCSRCETAYWVVVVML